MAASSVGLLVGAAFGAAWLGGHIAHENSLREQADQIQKLSHQNGQVDLADLNAADSGAPLDAGAMSIAERFSRFDHQGADNARQAQAQKEAMNALRTTSYIRGEKAQALQASLQTSLRGALIDDAQAASVSDHPVAARAASAFKFANHNQNDLDCLSQAVYYEARGEGQDGMRAVAQVIVNRVRNPNYPHSICAVVYQGASNGGACQFSFACDDSIGAPVERSAWRRARAVAKAALDGYVMSGVGTATSFHTVSVHPGWSATMQRVATIGSHVFYTFRGRSTQLNGVVRPSDTPAPVTVAERSDDNARTALLNALARDAGAEKAARPVAASAQIEGRAAHDIAAAVEKPAKAPAPAAS